MRVTLHFTSLVYGSEKIGTHRNARAEAIVTRHILFLFIRFDVYFDHPTQETSNSDGVSKLVHLIVLRFECFV